MQQQVASTTGRDIGTALYEKVKGKNGKFQQALVAARLSGQEAVQFMVAEYARMYEGSQVIAKPPMKMAHESTLGSAINSFYSDIASIEKSSTTAADLEKERLEQRPGELAPSPVPQPPAQDNDEAVKERKKKKVGARFAVFVFFFAVGSGILCA